MENEEILKTGISEDVYNDNIPQQFNSIEEIDKSFDNSEENIKSDNNDIPNQFNSMEEIDKSFNEKETPVNYTLEISEDDENITIEPKILKTGQVNYDKNKYKSVYKGNIYVKKNEKTNKPEIYADTDFISQELSDNEKDDNWFVKYISIFSNLPKDVALTQTGDLFKKLKNLKLGGISLILQIPSMTVDILANKDKKGTKKAIVTTTVRTGAIFLLTTLICMGIEALSLGAATPYLVILAPLVVDIGNFLGDKQISDGVDYLYDLSAKGYKIIFNKNSKKLKIETNDSKKLDNLINYLKKDEFKEIFSDIIVEDITKQREEQAEKIAKRIFENKISLLQDEYKNFKHITELQSNELPNPQKLQREIIKACKKADDMLIERLKEKYGEDIKISIDYSNCPDIISEYI